MSSKLIEVLDYNPEWATQFETLKSKLWPAIDKYADRIEHVGSTSIVGLAAKPVIDLDIVVNAFDKLPKIITALKKLNYEYIGDLGIKGREMFKHTNPEFKHNLYVCLDNCLSFRNHITLRDHLRTHPADSERYGVLKKQLAHRYSNDIDSYIDGKTNFILSILKNYSINEDELIDIQKVNIKSEIDIKSLGYRTDFIFNKFDGSVTDKGDYFVAKYNSNPNFFWGNLLLYKKPPQRGDFLKWKSDFKKELTHPNIYHITFAWDSPQGEVGEVSEFIENGFELDKTIVLTANEVVKPPKFNNEISVRAITSDQELEKAIQIQVSGGDDDHLSRDSWEEFYRAQMVQYKKMMTNNLGRWFGAFLGGELVGSLGLFKDKSVGRFQIVSTAPKHQRKGVCSTLVYFSGKYAFESMAVKTLVMVADEDYHAAKIYESVGFKPTQKQSGLCWWDKSRTQD